MSQYSIKMRFNLGNLIRSLTGKLDKSREPNKKLEVERIFGHTIYYAVVKFRDKKEVCIYYPCKIGDNPQEDIEDHVWRRYKSDIISKLKIRKLEKKFDPTDPFIDWLLNNPYFIEARKRLKSTK